MACGATHAMTTLRNTTQDAASEYLPRPEESSGNGNGHGKIFSLKRELDPDTILILEARRDALADQRLNGSMKSFFCRILDVSLDPAFYHPHIRGVVTISDTVNAETFGVSTRTIYTWKKAVESAGYVWLTEQYRKNMWPITTYHISCLHRPPRGRTDEGGTFGASGAGRSRPQNQPLGACEPGQLRIPLPGSRQKPKAAENAQVLDTSALTGKRLPVSPEENFRSDQKKTSGESGRKLPVSPEENFRSDQKKTSGESGSLLPVRPEADFRHIESQKGAVEGEPLERETRKEPLSVQRRGNALEEGGEGKGKPKTVAAENIFLLDVAAMMEGWRKGSSKAELANAGGWWRMGFRHDPDLMRRVLAEAQSMAKAGKIKESPGQAAVDLWKRWGGRCE